jgi:hypothetical protein
LVCELELNPADDGVPSACVVNFDNIHTLLREMFRCQVIAWHRSEEARPAENSPLRLVANPLSWAVSYRETPIAATGSRLTVDWVLAQLGGDE